MDPATKDKIAKGIKTTEFWVVLLMGILTTIMVSIQEHASNVLPIELQMKILGGLAVAYVVCRTVLKVMGLAATILRVPRGEPLPVPAPPAGVPLPELQIPSMRRERGEPWTALREKEIAQQEAADREAAMKQRLLAAHAADGGAPPPYAPKPPPVIHSSRPAGATPSNDKLEHAGEY